MFRLLLAQYVSVCAISQLNFRFFVIEIPGHVFSLRYIERRVVTCSDSQIHFNIVAILTLLS